MAKKIKIKTKKPASRKNTPSIFDRFNQSERFKRASNGVLAALLVVCLLGGGVMGLKHLESYVARLDVFTSSEVSVCLYTQPDWMSDALAREILADSFKPVHPHLLHIHQEGRQDEIPQFLAQKLAQNAWINRVVWVRRSFGGKYVINCEFREPSAMVRVDDDWFLIDSQGYLLPGKYSYHALADCGMIEIHGVRSKVPAIGQPWKASDLQAALKIVHALSNIPFRDQVRVVDVSNFEARIDPVASWITLRTDRNTTIRWGMPIGQERGLETTAAQKLSLLAGIYRRYGHIDFGRQFIDVRRSATHVDASVASVTPIEP